MRKPDETNRDAGDGARTFQIRGSYPLVSKILSDPSPMKVKIIDEMSNLSN